MGRYQEINVNTVDQFKTFLRVNGLIDITDPKSFQCFRERLSYLILIDLTTPVSPDAIMNADADCPLISRNHPDTIELPDQNPSDEYSQQVFAVDKAHLSKNHHLETDDKAPEKNKQTTR